MRRIRHLLLIAILLFTISVSAQHLSLVENRGEVGIMGGASFYSGDIASDILFYKPNFGVFYKKQLNDYVGLRLNYEYISIGANDIQSANYYQFKRGLNFTRTAHDVSLMGEFYFLKFINGNKSYRFTPYLGFGVGAWKSIESTTNLDTAKTQRTITYPINLGFKYNLSGPWNIFGEATYRFTNSDKIDFFADNTHHVPPAFQYDIQASTSGNDQYFTTKLGVSYNLLSIYGPDKPKKARKWFIFKSKENQPSKSSKGLFSFLKRK
jgi:hypothetical protein